MSRVIPLPLTKAQVVTSLSTHDMLSNIRYYELSEGGSRESECDFDHRQSWPASMAVRVR